MKKLLMFACLALISFAATGQIQHDPAELNEENLFTNPGLNGSTGWEFEMINAAYSVGAGKGMVWLNHNNRAGDPALKQTVNGLKPGASYGIVVCWRGGDHGPIHGLTGAKNIFAVDLDGKEIKRLTTDNNFTSWKVNSQTLTNLDDFIESDIIEFTATQTSHQIRFRAEVGADGDAVIAWVYLGLIE